QGRLQALASVYQNMAEAGHGAGVDALAFMDHVSAPYRTAAVKVEVRVAPADLALPSEQAGPLGMILNEAVCNSYKHAFPGRGGRVEVSLVQDGPGRLSLEVVDDGVGLSAKLEGGSLGVALMRQQAAELDGELEIANRRGGGTRVALTLPRRLLH